MKWAHDMVLASMREIFACFEGGSSEVKRERRALIAQTDGNIEVRPVLPVDDSAPVECNPTCIEMSLPRIASQD